MNMYYKSLAVLAILVLLTCYVAAEKKALVIIDVQNCFVEGGTLAVSGGKAIVPTINNIRTHFDHHWDMVVRTQDWHCPNHVSFASVHPGYSVFQQKELQYTPTGDLCKRDDMAPSANYGVDCTGIETISLTQTLWPDHCVINTTDAGFETDLITRASDVVIQKGNNCQLDSYSAFYDNGHFKKTQLSNILKAANIETVFFTGIALDYCVYYSASDSKTLEGFKTYVIEDATVGIAPATIDAAKADLASKGVQLIKERDLGRVLGSSHRQN